MCVCVCVCVSVCLSVCLFLSIPHLPLFLSHILSLVSALIILQIFLIYTRLTLHNIQSAADMNSAVRKFTKRTILNGTLSSLCSVSFAFPAGNFHALVLKQYEHKIIISLLRVHLEGSLSQKQHETD